MNNLSSVTFIPLKNEQLQHFFHFGYSFHIITTSQMAAPHKPPSFLGDFYKLLCR